MTAPRGWRAFAVLTAALLTACGSTTITTVPSGVGSSAGSGLPPAQTPAAATAPAATQPVAYADCTRASFGSALAPLRAPSDPHVYASAPAVTIDVTRLYLVTITTSRGPMHLCLQPALAPNTVNVIVTLARNRFFDGLTFHRVVPGFVIQGGDPTGSGNGGPGFQFNDEPVVQDYVAGALAMANAGANTNGSQFFVCIADDTSLPKQYNLFGKLSDGLDVAMKIQQGDVMQTVTVQQSS